MQNTKESKFSFEEFLLAESENILIHKQVIARQIKQAMKKNHVSTKELAQRMRTSHTLIYRILDEGDPSVTLITLYRVAKALGMKLTIAITP